MQYFDGEIRLAGDIMNTVPVHGVSASEVVALRMEHGEDSVINLVLRKALPLKAEEVSIEYSRLFHKYGRGTDRLERFERTFGIGISPRLIESLPDFDDAEATPVDPEEEKKDIRRKLKSMGVPVPPNATIETLREKLDEAIQRSAIPVK